MKSAEYWQKRFEQIAQIQFDKADLNVTELLREYDRATQTIKRDIAIFYQRFADNNGIVDYAETRKLLNSNQLKEFKMTVEEFIAKGKDNVDGRWTKQLNNSYYRTRISRLEALQIQIRQQAEMLAGKRQKDAESLLGDVYTDTYYRTLFELQVGTGIGVTFAKIDEQGLSKVLGSEFVGSNWSKRIWGDRDKLALELQTKLSQSFIRGDSIDRMSKDLSKRMGVSRENADRLIQTETAFFVEQATMEGYRQSGMVKQYEILATLDMRTSEICREMDGKVFKTSEMMVHTNCPPFHVNCRTTTMPYFEDEIDPGKRIARDSKDNSYYVPADMTYKKWMGQYAG